MAHAQARPPEATTGIAHPLDDLADMSIAALTALYEGGAVPDSMDGAPCVVLDYDKPENPWLIRKIHDELREVSPGLFLGPAMAKTVRGPKLLLYFACDFGNR